MTKDELKRYKYIGDEIVQLRQEIDRLRDDLMSPSGKVITWAPGAPKQDDKFAEVMARMDELEHELKEKLDECVKLRLKIEKAINSVSEPLPRILLRGKYIQGKTWDEVGGQAGYSPSHARRICEEAIKDMER